MSFRDFPQDWLDLHDAQALIDALPGSTKNSFISNKWHFDFSNGNFVSVNFNTIESLYKDHPDWTQKYEGDLILHTKLIWLSIAAHTSEKTYVSIFHGLTLFWYALAGLSEKQLTRDNCYDVLIFLLTHQTHQGRPLKISGVKSCASLTAQMRFDLLLRSPHVTNIKICKGNITKKEIYRLLKKIIPDITNEELSYCDWTSGGSHNSLTLDHGRFYVEHCLDFYQRNLPLATAIAETYRAVPKIAQSLGYTKITVQQLMTRLLMGYTPNEIKPLVSMGLSTIERIYSKVVNHFKSIYCEIRFSTLLLQDETLEEMIMALRLQPSSATVDRMRIITWNWMQIRNKAETERLLRECQPPLSWDAFIQQFDAIKQRSYREPCQVPTERDYRRLGLEESSNRRSFKRSFPVQLVNLVKKSGIISVVALTGWRAIEFGFTPSSIERINNKDHLDEYAFPYRYQINWYIFKSHGKVRKRREITFNIALLISRMQRLIGADENSPCLYSSVEKKRDIFDSSGAVKSAVKGLWGHFIEYYPGYQLLDDIQLLQQIIGKEKSGHPLTSDQEQQKERLLHLRSVDEWNQLEIDSNLKEAWRRCREEWQKVEFFFTSSSANDRKNWLTNYRKGTLRPDWIRLLDKYLLDETKYWLHSLSDHELKSSSVSKIITSDVLGDALYPTPHAFRHMWVEAVYRRYDGDAGWMIRSHFKHISRSMWLSYIRDKDNRRSHQNVKRQVISSLLHNYLVKGGKGYSGQLHVYLRRLTRNTKVQTPEEQALFVEQMANEEIDDIKANPWGYCLLKRRTMSKAKCAEIGEPQRHNASPNICLGCLHNLMQSTNVDWILLYISSHIEALQNPVVPAIFKASSFELVKKATRHVRMLNPDHEALPELQNVLDNYRAKQGEAT